MHICARFLERIRQLGQLVVDRIDIETFGRQLFRHGDEIVPRLHPFGDRLVEYSAVDSHSGLSLENCRWQSLHNCAGPGREHLVVRLHDGVIAVALAALGPVMLIEGLFVFAAVEQTGVGGMAKTATAAHAGDARRDGGVIAVASVAAGAPRSPRASSACP